MNKEPIQLYDIDPRAPCWDDNDNGACGEEIYAHRGPPRIDPGEGKYGSYKQLWRFGRLDGENWETLTWPGGTFWIARGYYIIIHEFSWQECELAPADSHGRRIDYEYGCGLKGTVLERHKLPGYQEFGGSKKALLKFCDAELSPEDLRLLKNSKVVAGEEAETYTPYAGELTLGSYWGPLGICKWRGCPCKADK